MHTQSIDPWRHDHTFGQDREKTGERRTLIVILVTLGAMAVEIIAGLVLGSMALLADGLHMASHSVALGLSAFAYIYARRHAKDSRFSFGTGKVNSLAGFTSAILLLGFALLMAFESIDRFFHPVTIEYNYAIVVAVFGLVINGASMLILGGSDGFHHDEHKQSHTHTHQDHNLRSAYLHVLADALTSLLAIFALLGGKFFGQAWLDPTMGVVGALLVANWSRGLIRLASGVLLDLQGPQSVQKTIIESIEQESDNRISDLHFWSVGPGIYATEIAVVTCQPRDPDYYKALLPNDLGLAHKAVEVHLCPHHGENNGSISQCP